MEWKVTLVIKSAASAPFSQQARQKLLQTMHQKLLQTMHAVRVEKNASYGEVEVFAESRTPTDAALAASRAVQKVLDAIDELPHWTTGNIVRTERVYP